MGRTSCSDSRQCSFTALHTHHSQNPTEDTERIVPLLRRRLYSSAEPELRYFRKSMCLWMIFVQCVYNTKLVLNIFTRFANMFLNFFLSRTSWLRSQSKHGFSIRHRSSSSIALRFNDCDLWVHHVPAKMWTTYLTKTKKFSFQWP